MEDSIKKLCDFPYKCELSRNELLSQKGYKKLNVDNYVVLYLVDEESKIVTANWSLKVRYAAKLWSEVHELHLRLNLVELVLFSGESDRYALTSNYSGDILYSKYVITHIVETDDKKY